MKTQKKANRSEIQQSRKSDKAHLQLKEIYKKLKLPPRKQFIVCNFTDILLALRINSQKSTFKL